MCLTLVYLRPILVLRLYGCAEGPGMFLIELLETYPHYLGDQEDIGDLPFMFKVLSINKALSIQVYRLRIALLGQPRFIFMMSKIAGVYRTRTPPFFVLVLSMCPRWRCVTGDTCY